MGHFHITTVEKAGANAIDSDCYVPASILPGRTLPLNPRAEAEVASETSMSPTVDPAAAMRRPLDLAQDPSQAQAEQNHLNHEQYEERTTRERMEIEHRQALRFKDALIDEMNHRTKNSLQMASAMLSMQARASSSTQVTEVLLDSAARLHVLAKVHELLYKNSDSTQGIFMPQLLKSLGDALRQSFGRQHPLVILEIACDSIELPTEQAVALALITNESVTNAYKHAFAIKTAGAIAVRLQRTQEGAIRLQIEDTGSGFAPPGGVESMGMKLIRSFADQLRGTLDVTSRGSTMGTAITLTLPGRVGV